jgi:predicted site-specific integrase-resolvase
MKRDKRYVVVYARGLGDISDQIRAGVAFAARRWPSQPIRCFSEEVGSPDRPALWKLLELCMRGRVRAVVVQGADRLCRHRVHLRHLRRFFFTKTIQVWFLGCRRKQRWI